VIAVKWATAVTEREGWEAAFVQIADFEQQVAGLMETAWRRHGDGMEAAHIR
jgi:hypothetical protein